ncbi:hypothetical protein ANAEL_05090 [Anaerolineales bacterium]|nr:hypothetical protein ANAEL_05090 [Anaerolineales bacterium]
MNYKQRAAATRFIFYSQLSLFGQWKFRRSLKLISSDNASLEVLLDFEKKIEYRSLYTWQILKYILNALSWYNREIGDDRFYNRLPLTRLPEMLQIVLVFIDKSQRLDFEYRNLILNILNSGNGIERTSLIVAGYTPKHFRLEAAELISNLVVQAGGWNWDRYYPYFQMSGDLLLRFSEKVACKVSKPELLKQFQHMALNALSYNGYSSEKLNYLEKIAGKVDDQSSFSEIFDKVVPVIGLEVTASIIEKSKDLQEFKTYFHRVTVQLKRWGGDYTYLFKKQESAVELNHLLTFLEIFHNQPRVKEYVLYTRTHCSGILYKYISGAISTQKGYSFQAILQCHLTETADIERLIESQIDQLERNIVNVYLNNVWHSSIKPQKIRWQFDAFTEYIPSPMISWDWTQDNEKLRHYWNSTEGESQEYTRYINELEPRLVSLLHTLDFSQFEALITIIPNYFSVQEFTKTVSVPKEWKLDIEYQEGYNKWAGFYTEKVEIARPIRFINHDFKFDRPYLQKALDLLDSMDQINEAIEGYKNFHNGTSA